MHTRRVFCFAWQGRDDRDAIRSSTFPFPPARPTSTRVRRLSTPLSTERILVLDGATGTALQGVDLTADDFGGPELEGCNENLCATRPDVVDGVHEAYLEAGCDIVETNTFGGTPLVLAEYGLADQAYELNAAVGRASPATPAPATTRRSARASSAARWGRPPRRSR